ncbi:glycosyltransferase [Pontibacter cellulosilyticus]|uniref:Glycosyltransferase n=1 Tax=Pontibacter cellulosilyticus TaxID=1720253 RepID=A0A923N532_9BACT|nr:glycosyltransferase [Pontibacter cellulosilyticus]MBC5992314.1 glycosyltransferase [Pontibacter cellulosilyticus]
MKWQVDIVPMFPATEENLSWHPEAKLNLNFKEFSDAAGEIYDLAILTWWKTVFEAYRINAIRYTYFVQSIESWFYPKDEVPLRNLVDSTYIHNLPVITEANWIKNHLYYHYSASSWLVLNGIRKDIYTPYGDKIEKTNQSHLRVLVEGPVNVDFKNVPKAIELCRKSLADEVWLLTSSEVDEYPGVDKVFSRVPINKTAEIYRSCDVIVKLSYVEGMFGPPLEMFHCGGTAIVYNVTGHDEYILNGVNGFVAKKDDEKKIIDYINLLKADTELLNHLKYEALKTALDWPGWSSSSLEFCLALQDICSTTKAPDSEKLFGSINQAFQIYVNEEESRKARLVLS